MTISRDLGSPTWTRSTQDSKEESGSNKELGKLSAPLDTTENTQRLLDTVPQCSWTYYWKNPKFFFISESETASEWKNLLAFKINIFYSDYILQAWFLMALDDRFENRCEFLPQLTPVVKSSPGTSFIHKEQGRKYRLKLVQEQALASSTALLSQCKLGSLPKFPSKVIILLEIREEIAWFHLKFTHAISPGDVWMFGEGRRKEENFLFER